jgi:hypothetical protein
MVIHAKFNQINKYYSNTKCKHPANMILLQLLNYEAEACKHISLLNPLQPICCMSTEVQTASRVLM